MSDEHDYIPMAEATEIAHRNYLSEFNEKVLPIYAHYGFSKDTALLAWMLCKIENRLDDVVDAIRDDATDDWQRES